jgi:hypothetical protein
MRRTPLIWTFAALAGAAIAGGASVLDGGRPAVGGAQVTFCDASFCGDPAMNERYESESPNLAFHRKPAPAPPAEKPKPSPSGTELVIAVGEFLFVTLPCDPSKFAFGNLPYDITPLEGDLVVLEGLSKGRSTVIGWCSNGSRIRYPVRVIEPAPH